MIRILVGVAMCLTLGACGGGNRTDSRSVQRGYSSATVASQAFATGPVSRACMAGGRKAANTRLCGCVQAVANQSLRGGGDQTLAASFFADPHQAQVIRQSDNPRHEEFWQRYKAFTARSEQVCRGL